MSRKIRDWTGVTIGTRRIDSFSGRYKNGVSVWRWTCLKCNASGRCSIGNIKARKCHKCSFKGRAAQSDRYLGCGDINQGFYLRMVRNAALRNYSWNVTPEYLWALFEQQSGRCGLSGEVIVLDPKWKCAGEVNTTASLDRKDSSVGYEPGNVWWIHKDYQPMKMNQTVESFVHRCRLVSQHFENTDK